MRIYNSTTPKMRYARSCEVLSSEKIKSSPYFCGGLFSPASQLEKAILQRNWIMKRGRWSLSKMLSHPILYIKAYRNKNSPYYEGWTAKEIKSVEGLQEGLESFKGLNIKQVHFILYIIKRNGLTLPVVRGCYHHCAHCYLGAKAPVERLAYEDFHNLLSDLSEMYKRFCMEPKSYFPSTLFWDSDCSEIYLFDKKGKIHDLTDLTKEFYSKLNAPLVFDTTGWNPRSQEAQKRMERFVEYCKDIEGQIVSDVNLSINPFHSLRTTALKQKQKGNIENYNKLYQKYLDMVANAINTFAPLMHFPETKFICRAYPDNMTDPSLNGYRIRDMKKLKKDILKNFIDKYPQTLEKYPKILEVLDRKISPEPMIVPVKRDNQLKPFANVKGSGTPTQVISNQALIGKALLLYHDAFIDLNGDFYIVNDFVTYKTNIKLNIGKTTNKPIVPPAHFQTIVIL